MIDATQPVVLAPATVAHAHSKTAQALTGADAALIEFGVARSFAYSVLRREEQASPIMLLTPHSTIYQQQYNQLELFTSWLRAKNGSVITGCSFFHILRVQIALPMCHTSLPGMRQTKI